MLCKVSKKENNPEYNPVPGYQDGEKTLAPEIELKWSWISSILKDLKLFVQIFLQYIVQLPIKDS